MSPDGLEKFEEEIVHDREDEDVATPASDADLAQTESGPREQPALPSNPD